MDSPKFCYLQVTLLIADQGGALAHRDKRASICDNQVACFCASIAGLPAYFVSHGGTDVWQATFVTRRI